MTGSSTYYTLVGSLPALPPHFEQAERLPISRAALAERLRMLEPQDLEVVEEMNDFLAWERQPMERTDDEMITRFNRFMSKVNSEFARGLIRQRFTLRYIIAALRCRRLKQDPPAGVEPIAARVASGWTHPDLRMGNQFPWIAEVDAQLNGDSPFDLERTILSVAWRYNQRLADQFKFTFEAVLLYVIRWDIVYRWTQRDAAAGAEKFEQLAGEAMGEFSDIFSE